MAGEWTVEQALAHAESSWLPWPGLLAAEVRRLRAEQVEVQCPNCDTTIRSRLGDQVTRAELERLRGQLADLAVEFRQKSAEFLEDWQDWDSHDGYKRCGQGVAYSDAADALDALARAHEDGGAGQ